MAAGEHRFDLSGQGFKRDPFPTFAAMRAAGPVIPSRIPLLGQVTFITTHAACDAFLRRSEDFAANPAQAGRSTAIRILTRLPGIRPLTENMLQKDGPEHRRLRRLVDGVFRRGAIAEWEPRIERIADRLLDRLDASRDGDLVRHVARDLPLAVICEMLGLPDADRPEFTRWMAAISEVSSIWGLGRFLPAVRRINRYLTAQFAERRAAPRDDLITALVDAEEEGDRLSETELLSMCFLLFVAGHETTTHLISGGVLALLQNPDQLERLRAEPDLGPSAVDELLRYVSPVQTSKPRFPLADTEVEGVTLRKGAPVMAWIAAANADPAAFDAPETLDIGREKNRHLAFGAGPHFCLGAWLAKLEVQILLRRLLDRYPGMALAVPEADLRWTRRVGMRALRALPLTLNEKRIAA